MKPQVTKESLVQWIAELESQPHLSLKEERYLAVMKELRRTIRLYDTLVKVYNEDTASTLDGWRQ